MILWIQWWKMVLFDLHPGSLGVFWFMAPHDSPGDLSFRAGNGSGDEKYPSRITRHFPRGSNPGEFYSTKN